MMSRRGGAVLAALVLLMGLASPAPAIPPLGDLGEEGLFWYEGVWAVTISEDCYRHSNGSRARLPVEQLYMSLRHGGFVLASAGTSLKNGVGIYSADFYTDKSLAKDSWVGSAILDFNFPFPGEESYLVNGFGTKEFPTQGYSWMCRFEFQGVLNTAVGRAKEGMDERAINEIKKLTEIKGWNVAWCDAWPDLPNDMEKRPAGIGHKCSSNWKADWIRPLPVDGPR